MILVGGVGAGLGAPAPRPGVCGPPGNPGAAARTGAVAALAVSAPAEAAYSGTCLTMSLEWRPKWTRRALRTAVLRARRMSSARLRSMVLRARALMTSMREAWMASSFSMRARGWRRALGGVATPRTMR